MAIPLVAVAAVAVGSVVAAGASACVYAYYSAEEAKANAELAANLTDLENAHASNPSRRIQALALLAAAVGASFVGYKYAPQIMSPDSLKSAAMLAGAVGVSFVGVKLISRQKTVSAPQIA